jgi:putative nucleotidyltransferase with HDIG domain
MIHLVEAWLSRRQKRREMTKKGLLTTRKRRTNESTLGRVVEQSKTFFAATLVCIWAVCLFVLVFPLHDAAPEDLAGYSKAPFTLYAEFNFSYENQELTGRARDLAWRQEPFVYRFDRSTCDAVLRHVGQLFSRIGQMSAPEEPGDDADTAVVDGAMENLTSSDQAALRMIQEIPGKWSLLMETLERRLYAGVFPAGERENRKGERIRIYKGAIREQPRSFQDVPTPVEAAGMIADTVAKDLSPANRETLLPALKLGLAELLRPTLIYDDVATEENRAAARATVKPVFSDVRKGDVIIIGGRILEKEAMERYRAYCGEKEKRKGAEHFWRRVLSSALLCLLLMILTGIYLSHIHPEVVRNYQQMGLTATVVIVAVLANHVVIGAFHRFSPYIHELPPAMITTVLPVALASILLSVLVGLRVALYAGLFVSLIAALQLDNSFHVVLNGMVVSGIAGFTVRHVLNHRAFYLRAALAISLTVPIMEVIHLWGYQGNLESIPWILGFGVANGVFTAFAALVLLFLLETVFQISTDMSLLLLCDYNHPLLKRLQFEAPGTYHHSLMVSTLAEQAAQAIGANAIRARVGALFHDIGKLSKPEYFVENSQVEDKHARLNPRMSSLIILNHVKEGVDLAIKYKLRRIIRDAIEQHHGTDMIQFFYNRAVEDNPDKDTPVAESDYRYPGPRPMSKEVVLISLADACEAASRALEKPTQQKIDAMVWEIFRKRIRSGQLDNAELTFGELAKVRRSFVKTLATMLHGRIVYPKGEAEEDDDEDDLFVAAKKLSGAAREGTAGNGNGGG